MITDLEYYYTFAILYVVITAFTIIYFPLYVKCNLADYNDRMVVFDAMITIIIPGIGAFILVNLITFIRS